MASAENSAKESTEPIAKTGMLIRKPVAEVFEAMVDPAITSRFWFTRGSGRLKPGAKVRWDWEMYDVSSWAHVQEFRPNQRIVIEWSGDDSSSNLEWRFRPLTDATTFVEVINKGFAGTLEERAKSAIDSAEGFALMLAGLKAYLEHDLILNLVGDRFPTGIA